MFRLSKLLEKLEDKLDARFKSWLARNKAKLPMRIPAVIVGWYFYGMFLNSLRLGIASTFHQAGEEIQSIWVLNPFKNWGALFTGFVSCPCSEIGQFSTSCMHYSFSVIGTIHRKSGQHFVC